MSELYVVTDIEADGPIPGPFSMRSLGSVAVTERGQKIGHYTFNLEPLPGAQTDQRTMNWWAEHPEAWEACNQDRQDPAVALPAYATWLKGLSGQVVFVSYPVAYDYMFTAWYLTNFAGECPFGWSGLDVKTMAMLWSNGGYLDTAPAVKAAFGRKELPHIALLDAEREAELFLELLTRLRRGE